jgi:hypothetical protein
LNLEPATLTSLAEQLELTTPDETTLDAIQDFLRPSLRHHTTSDSVELNNHSTIHELFQLISAKRTHDQFEKRITLLYQELNYYYSIFDHEPIPTIIQLFFSNVENDFSEECSIRKNNIPLQSIEHVKFNVEDNNPRFIRLDTSNQLIYTEISNLSVQIMTHDQQIISIHYPDEKMELSFVNITHFYDNNILMLLPRNDDPQIYINLHLEYLQIINIEFAIKYSNEIEKISQFITQITSESNSHLLEVKEDLLRMQVSCENDLELKNKEFAHLNEQMRTMQKKHELEFIIFQQKMTELNQRNALLNDHISQHLDQIESLNNTLIGKNKLLIDTQNLLDQLLNSKSWKITKLFRKIANEIRVIRYK